MFSPPILWRYLIFQYLKVLALSVTAFVVVLLTLRLDEIAHFATLGPEGKFVWLFTLHQIPYILPIAIPVSALLSSTLLMNDLSASSEITAMRASGFSLYKIFTPLLLTASMLAVFCFIIVSEFATHSHLSTSLLKYELRSVNPLLLLHNKHLMKLKGFYFESFGASQLGESAEDSVIAFKNKQTGRVNLIVAEEMKMRNSGLKAGQLSLIATKHGSEENSLDTLLIENHESAEIAIKDFSQMIHNKMWNLNNDHLSLPMLVEKLKNDTSKACRSCIFIELVRRVSTALAVFSFTLLGLSFGVTIGRHGTRYKLGFVMLLSVTFLVCYFSAKGLDSKFWTSITLYTAPHILIAFFSFLSLYFLSHGKEGRWI